MSLTFTKLFSSITESTIWSEPDHVRILWITMLAMADRLGRVWGSVPGLANRARLTIELTESALDLFQRPDKYSRTPDNEGRRIERIDGGWRLLNHAKYREIRDEEAIKSSKRNYINARRSKEREAKALGVTPVDRPVEKVDRSRALENSKNTTPAHAPLPPEPAEEVVEAWNASGFPKVKQMTAKRTAHLKARMASSFWRENWRRALDIIQASDFCNGRIPSRDRQKPWVADFDWFSRSDDAVAKAIEGKYNNQPTLFAEAPKTGLREEWEANGKGLSWRQYLAAHQETKP